MKLLGKLVFARVPCSVSMFLYQGGMPDGFLFCVSCGAVGLCGKVLYAEK